MKYVLLIYQPDPFDFRSLPESEQQVIGKAYKALNDASNIEPGLPLGLPRDAVTVRVGQDGLQTTQGPFVKRGVGWCKSMPGAVRPYERVRDRPKSQRRKKAIAGKELAVELPAPTDLVFPGNYLKMFNNLLDEQNLKLDRDEKPRTAYSLRHTYICLRLMEGADVYAIAKNCRTSVEMIEKFYAAHIKTTLDASVINSRKPKRNNRAHRSPKAAAPPPLHENRGFTAR